MGLKWLILPITVLMMMHHSVHGQNTLPSITVKNYNGHIIVSWLNDYSQPVSNLSIQRSYDSLRNFVTIGSVLNPLNKENGFSDNNPPYDNMYYRVFISFEGGQFAYSEVSKPIRENDNRADNAIRYSWQVLPEKPLKKDSSAILTLITSPKDSTSPFIPAKPKYNNRQNIPLPKNITAGVSKKNNDSTVITVAKEEKKKEETGFPSKRIYTTKDEQVLIDLPDASLNQYHVRFFDEKGNQVFMLSRIQEDNLYIEKVNFIRSGWFLFELYNGSLLIEKNKFFIPKDAKNN